MNSFPKFLAKYGEIQKVQAYDISDFKDLYWMHVPEGMMEFFETYQISCLMNGFLWSLNPMEHFDWFHALLKDSSDLELIKIPFARTVFGDIFYIESETINLFKASHLTLSGFAFDANSLFEWTLIDVEYIDGELNYNLFEKIEGKSKIDNCFPLEFDNQEIKIGLEIHFEEFKKNLLLQKEQIKWKKK